MQTQFWRLLAVLTMLTWSLSGVALAQDEDGPDAPDDKPAAAAEDAKPDAVKADDAKAADAKADPNAEPAKPADAGADKPADLTAEQAQVAEKFRDLEKVLIRMAELTASTDPRRAALLRQAVAQSKDRDLDTQFDKLVDLLKQDRLALVVKNQSEVHQDLTQLLELLLSEDRGKRIESEKTRIRDYLKRINKIIKQQKGLQAGTAGEEDTEKLAEGQGKLADETGELAKDIDQSEGAGKPPTGAGKPGDKSEDGDKPSDGEKPSGDNPEGSEKQPGDADKPSGDKPANGDKPAGDPKKPGDKSSGKPSAGKPSGDKPSGDKSSGKPSGDKPSKDKPTGDKPDDPKPDADKPNGDKPDADKPDSDKPDSDKPDSDKAEPGKSGDKKSAKGKGKPSPGKPPKGKPKPGQPGEGDEGEPDDAQSPPEDAAEEDNPAQKRIAQAEEKMKEARRKLEEAKRGEALDKQEEALRKLEEAKAELEEILRQLREEEIARTLAALEGRFRKMLAMQIEVYEGTKRQDKVPAAERDRDDEIEAGRLSRKEAEIVAEADRAQAVLHEEASAVAFPEAVDDMRDDMEQVVVRLAQSKVGTMTQATEEDIITALEEMIAALKKAQKDLEEKKQQPPGKSQPGEPGEPPLVDSIAELKVIRALQMRVNKRTQRYTDLTKSSGSENAADKPELLKAIKRLADRQQRIHRVTRDIVVGRNK